MPCLVFEDAALAIPALTQVVMAGVMIVAMLFAAKAAMRMLRRVLRRLAGIVAGMRHRDLRTGL